MTIREMRDELKAVLTPTVGESEARAMANVIIEDTKGYTPTQIIMYGDRVLLDETVDRLRRIADRIVAGEPMQYVIGSARFRGRDFKVNPSVLIPRPETGQLVDMIADRYGNQRDMKVLDIGCGSGCIAISLALDLPFAAVDAIDISAEAVKTTEENAHSLKARVNALKADIFNVKESAIYLRRYNVIVSNPPYILESEAASIDSRVKDYEPHTALFVPEDQPIAIYTAIADFAAKALYADGGLYLEINPLCADMIAKMLSDKGFYDVEILPDYKGNKRFAVAYR